MSVIVEYGVCKVELSHERLVEECGSILSFLGALRAACENGPVGADTRVGVVLEREFGFCVPGGGTVDVGQSCDGRGDRVAWGKRERLAVVDDGRLCEDAGRQQNVDVGSVSVPVACVGLVGPNGGRSYGRGRNYARNCVRRGRKKAAKKASDAGSAGGSVRGGESSFSHRRVTSQEEQDKFAREWYERKSVENKLAIKEAELRLKRYEDDEASGFDVKKVRAWQLGVEDRIRTLSGKSSSRGDSAASSLPCNSLNPPSSMTSVSERERVLEERCAELEAFKKRVEGGNVKGQGARVQLLEGKLKAATVELEDLRAAWERELKMRAGDLKYARERGF